MAVPTLPTLAIFPEASRHPGSERICWLLIPTSRYVDSPDVSGIPAEHKFEKGGFENLPLSFKIQLPQSVLVDIQLESNICDRAALVGGANRDGVCAKRSGTIDEDHGRRGIDTDAGRVSVP